MVEPAPGRFSTTTCWPTLSVMNLPASRAMVSIGPPGGNGTIILIGLSGEAGARARVATPAPKAAAADSSARRVTMRFPSSFGDRAGAILAGVRAAEQRLFG